MAESSPQKGSTPDPLPKGVIEVMNLETKKPFTITAVAFLEMWDDTYGDAGNKKKKFKVLRGAFTPPAPGKKAKGRGAGNAERVSRQRPEDAPDPDAEEEEDDDETDEN